MQETIELLIEYTEFFEQMEIKQAEKLGMLLTRELGKVESALLLEESMKKQMESMEKKRLQHFASQGLVGKHLKELVEESSGTERETLRKLQRRLEDAVSNIRFYNNKSNELAREELIRLRGTGMTQDNPAGIYSPQTLPPRKGQKLEKKA